MRTYVFKGHGGETCSIQGFPPAQVQATRRPLQVWTGARGGRPRVPGQQVLSMVLSAGGRGHRSEASGWQAGSPGS